MKLVDRSISPNTTFPESISRLPSSERKSAAELKYSKAVEMYATTDMPIIDIARLCDVSASGLSAHLGKYHRPLLFQRYGLDPKASLCQTLKVKPRKGQSYQCYIKYREAIEACSDMAYIEFNVSQIARMFGLDGISLSSQLHAHYPTVIDNREILRHQLGVADNAQRGPRKCSQKAYAEALDMYRDTDKTIPEVAESCGVSPRGLTQFLRFYHKDIIEQKAERRRQAKRKVGSRRPGHLAGNGNVYGPKPETIAKYAPALELYKTTGMTINEIVDTTGVSYAGFRGYLHQWHKGECVRRRGYEWDGGMEPDLNKTRHYLKSVAEKYAEAIASLKANPRSINAVASEFGHNPEVFREYLKKHEPELASTQGMMVLPNGRLVKRSAMKKYGAAIDDYTKSTDSLKNIAERHGIVYTSIVNFIKRNCPEVHELHKRLLEQTSSEEFNI
jgi:predicted DNA-binding protein YlxM (UPF0122 family)